MGGEVIIWDIKVRFQGIWRCNCGVQKGGAVDFGNSPFFFSFFWGAGKGGGVQGFCAILGCKRVQQVLRTHPCSQLDDLCLDEKVPVLGLHRRRVSVHRCAKALVVLKLCGNISTPL